MLKCLVLLTLDSGSDVNTRHGSDGSNLFTNTGCYRAQTDASQNDFSFFSNIFVSKNLKISVPLSASHSISIEDLHWSIENFNLILRFRSFSCNYQSLNTTHFFIFYLTNNFFSHTKK